MKINNKESTKNAEVETTERKSTRMTSRINQSLFEQERRKDKLLQEN